MYLPKKIVNLNGQDLLLNPVDIAYERRTIMLTGEVTDESAVLINASLRVLAQESKEAITLYINSPGGSTSAGISICDMIKACGCPVRTVATGMTASIAALIFAAGSERYVNQHAQILIHQPLARMSGQISDLKIHMDYALCQRELIYKLLSEFSGQSIGKIADVCERDFIMDSEEAVTFGIADRIGDPIQQE